MGPCVRLPSSHELPQIRRLPGAFFFPISIEWAQDPKNRASGRGAAFGSTGNTGSLIRGHVACSFLALVLFQELQLRLVEHGWSVEWTHLKDDLDALKDVPVESSGQPFIIPYQTRGHAGKALGAARIALAPALRVAHNNHARA